MILVVGGSGMLGGAIIRRLVARGERVRALVRDASTDKKLTEAGVETVSGDLKDPISLPAACDGASIVITTANSAGRGGKDNVETVDLEGNRNLIEAASRSDVEHFIFVSVQGEDPDSPVPFVRAKGITSNRLRESGMAYTVLMPDAYMDVWIPLVVLGPVGSGQPIALVGEGTHKHYLMAVDDVAGFAVAATANSAARNRDLMLGGPEALSWRDVISTFERVGGVKAEVESLQPGEPMPGFPDAVSGLMAALETYDSPAPISKEEAERTFGVRLTRLEEFLQRQTG
ncbi:MAG: SDR family oxidoreductase [Actinomycetota bacterium]|nr:SDR family oxidoreductase [Actinomycetota bacterium]